MPAAVTPEKDGSYTNTMRLVQYHDKAVEPPGDARSEAHFVYHLGRRLRELYADSTLDRDRPIQSLTWEYPTHGPLAEPDVEAVLAEINGYTVVDGKPVAELPGSPRRRLDGLRLLDLQRHHAGARPQPRPRRRDRATSQAPRSAGATPGRTTSGSSTTAPRPIRTAGPGPSASGTSGGTTSRALDRPRHARLPADQGARLPAGRRRARASTATPATQPFLMLAEGLGRLFVPKRAQGRPAPDPLRAVRVADGEPALRPAGQPGRHRPRPLRQPPTTPIADATLPARPDHLPPDRAPHGRRDEPLGAVAGRASAGGVRRDRDRACRRARHRQRRLGRHLDGARRDRDARPRHRPHPAADGRRAAAPPGRAAVALTATSGWRAAPSPTT